MPKIISINSNECSIYGSIEAKNDFFESGFLPPSRVQLAEMQKDPHILAELRSFLQSHNPRGIPVSKVGDQEVIKEIAYMLENRYAYMVLHKRYSNISPYAEILICDRAGYGSSSFGHVAMVIDDKVYSQSHSAIYKDSTRDFHIRNRFRNLKGFVLNVSSSNIADMRQFWEERIQKNLPYSIIDNNCTSLVQGALRLVGIEIRQSIADSPGFLLSALNRIANTHSPKIRDVRIYPQGWVGK